MKAARDDRAASAAILPVYVWCQDSQPGTAPHCVFVDLDGDSKHGVVKLLQQCVANIFASIGLTMRVHRWKMA